ncbi:MAG: SDR family NAD(P)-dependent oxidoreductase [Butyrivibrio sp.]|nr:SDR family NAD(P)-dependent oxidoreductase [Butyrivibrio sp.]
MNRKVLITGASRGIGRAIAVSFAKSGDELYITCKNSEKELVALAWELEKTCGIKCSPFVCDVSDPEAVRKLFSRIPEVDILVNNAGIAWMGLLTDMTDEDWHSVMGTNLDSLFYMCTGAIPGMVKRKSGRIINISSVWGSVGASCEVAYSASKGGVNAFTKALAKELAPSNIQVNAVSCGVIDTDMNRKHLTNEDLKDLEEEIPAGRMGDAGEVADMVLKLAEAPFYLTGQIITIDGAWI